MFLYKKERECVCVCVLALCGSQTLATDPHVLRVAASAKCAKCWQYLEMVQKPPTQSHTPSPSPFPQVEETHRTSPMNSSPSSNLSKLRVSSETSEKRGRTFHPYSPLFVSFSIVFMHLGCILCHSKGLTIKEGRFVCWVTLLGKAYAFTLVYNRVKAHYGDPLWGTFTSTTKSIFIWISQNVVHLILSLNFGVLVLKFLFS
jgi:hypothetical protein